MMKLETKKIDLKILLTANPHSTERQTSGAMFTAGIRPVFPVSAEARENPGTWHDYVYCQLHIDAHFGSCKEIYKDLDTEALEIHNMYMIEV